MQQGDDLEYYFGILRRRYPYFIIAFLTVLAVAAFVAVTIPAIYRSEAKILVESQQIPTELVRSTVTGLADERIQITRQRITSRDALIQIADKYDLFPDERKKMTASGLVDLIRQRILILPFDLALTGRKSREGSLSVAFTVGFEYERPEIASKVANELVTLILNEDIRSRTSKASETTQFLNRESDRLQQELAKIDKVLTDFKQANRDALPERVPFQMAALERVETNLKSVDREIGELNETKRLLALELSVRRAAQTDTSKDGRSDDPLRQLAALRSELAQKSAIYATSHPDIKALKSQIRAFEEQTKNAVQLTPDDALTSDEKNKLDLSSRIVAEKMDAIDRQLKLDEDQKIKYTSAIAELNGVLSQAPEVQASVSVMERQRDNLRKTLEEIAGKLAAAKLGEQLEKDQQAERFEVIEQPITPQLPVRPDRIKILTLGFGLAGIAGAMSVAGLELLNQSIRTSNDIVRAFNKHPVAVVTYINTPHEGRRRTSRIFLFWLLFLMTSALALAAIHFLYMPLDLILLKVISRFGI
jgi:polysaccharide biosynthesis transport protein